jgi:hypothetical protein
MWATCSLLLSHLYKASKSENLLGALLYGPFGINELAQDSCFDDSAVGSNPCHPNHSKGPASQFPPFKLSCQRSDARGINYPPLARTG